MTVTTTWPGRRRRAPATSNPAPATTMSAASASGPSRATVTDRLEVCRNSKSPGDPWRRSGRPPWGSTTTTSAPASASSLVA